MLDMKHPGDLLAVLACLWLAKYSRLKSLVIFESPPEYASISREQQAVVLEGDPP